MFRSPYALGRRSAALLAMTALALTAAASTASATPRGPAAPAAVRTDGILVQGWFYNETTYSLTLKAEHLCCGVTWNPRPPDHIPPRTMVTWIARPGPGANSGYVTYTVDRTGGQGYAYMSWTHAVGGDFAHDVRAGGLFTIDYRHFYNDDTFYFRCQIPTC
ncbi:hypothetical protein [Actinomadura sp. NPDC000600]|uniref:hypothetical protein n=1 Tax=Actinomadura sp. NPDC000600 TaxID=3154262 RepID=UPI003399B000